MGIPSELNRPISKLRTPPAGRGAPRKGGVGERSEPRVGTSFRSRSCLFTPSSREAPMRQPGGGSSSTTPPLSHSERRRTAAPASIQPLRGFPGPPRRQEPLARGANETTRGWFVGNHPSVVHSVVPLRCYEKHSAPRRPFCEAEMRMPPRVGARRYAPARRRSPPDACSGCQSAALRVRGGDSPSAGGAEVECRRTRRGAVAPPSGASAIPAAGSLHPVLLRKP